MAGPPFVAPTPPPRLPPRTVVPQQTPDWYAPGAGPGHPFGPATPHPSVGGGPLPGLPNKPLWQMTPAELQQAALAQANALYEPQLNEYHYQQDQLARQQAAAEQGMQALITALQNNTGSGQYSDIFRQEIANAGMTDVLQAKNQYASQGQDILHNIAQLEGEISGKAYDIYGGYQNSISDYQKQKSTDAYKQQQLGLSQQRVALQAANQLTQATNTVWVPGADGRPVQATGKDGKPIRTDDLTPYQIASLQQRAAGLQSTNQYRNAQLGLGRQRLVQGQERIDLSAQNAQAKGAKPKYTAIQITRFKSDAADTAKDAFFGVSHVDKTTGHTVWDLPPQHYQQAVNDMVAHGIPLDIAQRALNRYWKRPGYDRDVKQMMGEYGPKSKKTGSTTYWFPSGTGRPTRSFQQRNPQKGIRTTYSAASIKTHDDARQAGLGLAASNYGWTGAESQALDQLWTHESGWDWKVTNHQGSGATGIPQALPASKMSSAGADWRTNPLTQIKWGLGYIKSTYGTPSRAWAFWQATVNRNAGLAPSDLQGKAQQWISKGYTGY